jgi:uncharacterized protein YkwD
MLDDVWRRRHRPIAAALGAGALALVALVAPAAATAGTSAGEAGAAATAARGCTGAATRAARARRGLAATITCLVNRKRRAHGLPPLHRNRALGRAARRHAHDMARRGYFAHQRLGGPAVGARVQRAGWRGSAYGEAIAWGCGRMSSPSAAVRMLMASPSHRVLLLARDYDRIGPGVARRAPSGCQGGVTWVLDFGRR